VLVTASERYYAEGEGGWPLWVVPVPVGAPSRISGVQALTAAPSPDGRLLAVSQRVRRLAIRRRDGTLVREWSGLLSDAYSIGWSPDGRRLRFSALGPDRRQVWVWEVATSGGEPRPVWPGAGGGWTRDGRYFFFVRSSGEAESGGAGSPGDPGTGEQIRGRRGDIYAAREPRFDWLPAPPLVQLTFGPMSYWRLGSSPDGRRLFAWGDLSRGDLVRYDVKAGRYEKYLDGVSALDAEFSADGEWVAYVSYPDSALWRSRADGHDRLRLTGPGWEARLPRWSPDASSLVFAGRPRETEAVLSVWRIGRDGGPPEVLARSPVGSDLWDACWLADGRTVVYSHRSNLHAAARGLYRVDVSSRAVSLLPGGEKLLYPKCSARGDILGYEVGQQVYRGTYWALFAGKTRWERMGSLGFVYPNWSGDGRFVTGLVPLRQRIERWSRATGTVEPVVSIADEHLVAWRGGPWMGLAPDGSPMIVRDRSTLDLYALEWEAP
jgi:WD40 repeat protein